MAGQVKTVPCKACGEPANPRARGCKRCSRLLNRIDPRGRPDKDARVRALVAAWDREGRVFRCCYSGVPLLTDVEDRSSPRYFSWDHTNPGEEGEVVVCALVVNDMKSDMTIEEFNRLIRVLSRRLEGGPGAEPDDFVLQRFHRGDKARPR